MPTSPDATGALQVGDIASGTLHGQRVKYLRKSTSSTQPPL
jgi:hypothetical protein